MFNVEPREPREPTINVGLRVSESVVRQIDRIANEKRATRSDVVRAALNEAIRQYDDASGS